MFFPAQGYRLRVARYTSVRDSRSLVCQQCWLYLTDCGLPQQCTLLKETTVSPKALLNTSSTWADVSKLLRRRDYEHRLHGLIWAASLFVVFGVGYRRSSNAALHLSLWWTRFSWIVLSLEYLASDKRPSKWWTLKWKVARKQTICAFHCWRFEWRFYLSSDAVWNWTPELCDATRMLSSSWLQELLRMWRCQR